MDSTPLVRCDIQQRATDRSDLNQAEACGMELRTTDRVMAGTRDCSDQFLRCQRSQRPSAFPTYWRSVAGNYAWPKRLTAPALLAN